MPIKDTVYFRSVYFAFGKFVNILTKVEFCIQTCFLQFFSALLFIKRINLIFSMFYQKGRDDALTGQFFISPSVFAVRIICANSSLGGGSDPRASRRCACVLKIQRKTFV